MLTARVKAPGQPSRAAQPASWRQAWSSTNEPSFPIRPFFSAKGMKSSGGMTAPLGWRQRTSAPTPVSDRAFSENSGW